MKRKKIDIYVESRSGRLRLSVEDSSLTPKLQIIPEVPDDKRKWMALAGEGATAMKRMEG